MRGVTEKSTPPEGAQNARLTFQMKRLQGDVVLVCVLRIYGALIIVAASVALGMASSQQRSSECRPIPIYRPVYTALSKAGYLVTATRTCSGSYLPRIDPGYLPTHLSRYM